MGCASGPKPPSFKREYSPVESTDFKYEDKNILFTYKPVTLESAIPVVFTNKTTKPIKVIWDETVFIEATGQSEKVIHDGVRLIDRSAPMTPSIILPKGNLVDAITPSNRVYWNYNTWDYLMICGTKIMIPFTGFEEKDEECVGKTFGLFVTYEIEGKKSSFSVKYKFDNRQKEIAITQ